MEERLKLPVGLESGSPSDIGVPYTGLGRESLQPYFDLPSELAHPDDQELSRMAVVLDINHGSHSEPAAQAIEQYAILADILDRCELCKRAGIRVNSPDANRQSGPGAWTVASIHMGSTGIVRDDGWLTKYRQLFGIDYVSK